MITEISIGLYETKSGRFARVTSKNEKANGWNGTVQEDGKDSWLYWNNDGTTYNPEYALIKRLSEDPGDGPRYPQKVRCRNCGFRGIQLLKFGIVVDRCNCTNCGTEFLEKAGWFR